MNKHTITIHGDKFSDLETFYDEIDNVLTKDLNWQTGHNLMPLMTCLEAVLGFTNMKNL